MVAEKGPESVASIEQDIVDWAAGRAPWQQNLIIRIARDEVIDQAYVDEVGQAIVDSSVVLTGAPLVIADLPSSSSSGARIDLASVGDLTNVNALLPAQTLSFGATGLTAIYGDNGSGKSGYARLIKEVVGARHQESVLPNAYAGGSGGLQSASITYSVNGSAIPGEWPALEDVDLRQIHFYDEACGDDYIESETELSYRPSVLKLFDRLIETTDQIRTAIDSLVLANGDSKGALPLLTAGTKAAVFLTGLSATTTEKQINDFVELAPDADEALASLLQEEARMKGTDPGKEKVRLKTASDQLTSLATHFEEIESVLSATATEKVLQLQSTAQDLRAAADLASAIDFASEPLPGVGTESWRALWLAAQKYSEVEAYPDRVFPVIDADAHCVFCQQPLLPDARVRLSTFHVFVHNETANNAKTAEDEFAEALLAIEEMVVSTTDTTAALAFLTTENAKIAKTLKSALEKAQSAKDRIAARLRTETEEPVVALDEIDIADLRSLATAVAGRSANIDSTAFNRLLADITAKKIELSDLMQLSKNKAVLLREVERLSELALLTKARAKVGTGPMTTKSSDLARTYVTGAVSDRFIRESDRLLLDHVVLGDKGGDKGKLRHRPALLGATDGNLPSEVLSEGEQTALGLAGLFTEIYFDESKSAVVLDDPVSSLDHARRKKTAQRIVEIAADRQVIVFTHDLTFLGELVTATEDQSVPLTERSIERNGSQTPGFVLETYPWKAKDAKKRLNDLQEGLAKIKKSQSGISADEYEIATSAWAGSLSETWERLVRSEVIYKVVDRGTTEVRPKLFRLLARITEEDDRDFQAGYGEASEWARRHDKSEEVNTVAPTIDDMQKELDRAIAWHKRMVDYAKP